MTQLKFINNSNTAVIVLHEIYGINKHMSDICKKLSTYGYDVFCPDLLNRDYPFDYNQEDVAYQTFYEDIGFEKAFNKIKNLLKKYRKRYKQLYVVGYSIGATIAWLCSEEKSLCDAVIGLYGSRIRDYLEVIPKCPVLLFFPTEEKAFDVIDLINSLSEKDKVKAKALYGKHGFADPFSKNYVEQSFNQANIMMFSFLVDLLDLRKTEVINN